MAPTNRHNSYPNARALKSIGGLIRALDFVHPVLASALASRLFFMPFSRGASSSARRALSTAESLSLPFRGSKLAVYSWGQGPTVLLLHGWASNAGSMRHLVDSLTQAGFRALALDAPAHGASPGRMTNLVEYGAAIRAAMQRFGPIHAVFAHSFGATAALLLLAENPGLPVGAAIVNNPPAEASALLQMFGTMLDLPDRTFFALRERIEADFGHPIEYYSLNRHAASLALPGMLMVDPGDSLAKFEDMRNLAALWDGAQLVTTEGLGHQGALRDEKIIDEIVTFIQNQGDDQPRSIPFRTFTEERIR